MAAPTQPSWKLRCWPNYNGSNPDLAIIAPADKDGMDVNNP